MYKTVGWGGGGGDREIEYKNVVWDQGSRAYKTDVPII